MAEAVAEAVGIGYGFGYGRGYGYGYGHGYGYGLGHGTLITGLLGRMDAPASQRPSVAPSAWSLLG